MLNKYFNLTFAFHNLTQKILVLVQPVLSGTYLHYEVLEYYIKSYSELKKSKQPVSPYGKCLNVLSPRSDLHWTEIEQNASLYSILI